MAGLFIISLSYLLLAAHALRGGDGGLAVFMIGTAGIAFSRERWAGNVAGVMLGCGSLIWLAKGAGLINLRIGVGGDWGRLAVIMGALFATTIFSAAYCFSPAGRERFSRSKDQGWFRAAIFLMTALLLEITRNKVAFPILLTDRFFPGWGRAEIFFLACYASWLGGKMFSPEGAKAMRPRIWALFSLVFFGQLALGLAGIEQFLMTGKLHLPVPALIAAGPVYRGSGFFMPILFTVSVLLVGPAWCSHLCYIGAWDDQCSRVGDLKPSRKFNSRLIWLRLVLLVLVVGAAWGMRTAGVSVAIAVWSAALFGLAGIAVMFWVSRRMGMMVHCTAFCPMGIVSNLLGRISPWRMKISDDCCKCMKCSKACRYNALKPVDIEAGRPGISCTLCGDCLSSCSSSSLGYRLPVVTPKTARMVFLVIVITLHALFLGVARI
ncbi:4Fe-4S binding protein [Maridesulfovibrio sp.]|uniref:4Fe-4S binding protein n=1 Tax=Maridesulfovibrio sp. TaxID=2795000 RepID=UPI002A18B7CD|nr:4Fe-4S binding protein [Maridesulfovibrio sp.]